MDRTWPSSRPPYRRRVPLYADHFDRGAHGNELYIGQTGDVARRLAEHRGQKRFWTALMVFTSAADWMNVAYTANVERQFIEWARLANRYEVQNGDNGREEHLGAEDQARLDHFLDGVRPVLRLAGIDVFERNLDGLFTYKSHWCGPSWIRLVQGYPDPAVEILAGSEISVGSDDRSGALALPGAQAGKEGDIVVFTETVHVSIKIDVSP